MRQFGQQQHNDNHRARRNHDHRARRNDNYNSSRGDNYYYEIVDKCF